MDERLGRRSCGEYAALSNSDFAIEAVFEDMGVKEQVFNALDAVMKEGASWRPTARR